MLLLVKVLEPLLNDGFYKNQILVLYGSYIECGVLAPGLHVALYFKHIKNKILNFKKFGKIYTYSQ